jgi:hypothetical protein
LASLYLETRSLGYDIGCGMMARSVRSLVRRVGVPLEQLGPEREYLGELRAPVRFAADMDGRGLLDGWPSTA